MLTLQYSVALRREWRNLPVIFILFLGQGEGEEVVAGVLYWFRNS
jgi:hypothetical protein